MLVDTFFRIFFLSIICYNLLKIINFSRFYFSINISLIKPIKICNFQNHVKVYERIVEKMSLRFF